MYKKKGFTKPIIVHLDEQTHSRLVAIARKEDRSLQVTVRRLLENYSLKKIRPQTTRRVL